MSCSSTSARPSGPETSCFTRTKQRAPLRPCLTVTSWTVEVRLIVCIDAQRLVEGEAAAGPHAAGQRHGGQEAASGGVAVGCQQRLPGGGEEVEPVPERRQRITGPRRRIVTVERRGQRGDREARDGIGQRLLPADPRSQVIDVQLRSCQQLPGGVPRPRRAVAGHIRAQAGVGGGVEQSFDLGGASCAR